MPDANATRRPRVVFFAGGDPLDVSVWSGTPYYALRALEAHFDVVYVERDPFPRGFGWLSRAIFKLSGRRLELRMVPAIVRLASFAARRRIRRAKADFSISAAASNVASMLDASTPQVLVSDATSIAMSKYYHRFDRLWPWVQRGYVAMEREAMGKAALLTYPTDWAARSACEDFAVSPGSIAVLPWGPNMSKPSGAQPRKLEAGPVRLLFVGLDWDRKGGDFALEIMRDLADRDQEFSLDIIGARRSAANVPIPRNVKFHGRLSKSKPEEAALFDRIFTSAHLLLLPSRAEAFGIVFAEAAAWGLPSVACAIGGIPTVVKDGETGLLLPSSASAPEFASVIAELVDDPDGYRTMSQRALQDSASRLDWDVWARSLRNKLNERAQ